MTRRVEHRPRIRILPVGRLANQMFQYMVALRIQDLVPDLEIVGLEMDEWSLTSPSVGPRRKRTARIEGHLVPIDQIARYLTRGVLEELESAALGFRLENLRPVGGYSGVFEPAAPIVAPTYGEGHIVVHIRVGELFEDPHPDYGPMPLSFIEAAVAASGAEPVFVGQLGSADPYSLAIRDRFAGATFLPGQDRITDFQIIRNASQIVVAVSTFSWLASWLSHAERIHLPISGQFHPERRPDIDLLPVDDPRYNFYRCEPRPWNASEEDIEYLLAGRDHEVLSVADVAALRDRMSRSTQKSLRSVQRRLAMAAYAAALPRLPRRHPNA